MNPQNDPLADYFDSLREERLSPHAETLLKSRLAERRVGRFALVATPVAAMALTYAFLLWCANLGPTNVPDVGPSLLEHQMTATGLAPEAPGVDLSSRSGRGA